MKQLAVAQQAVKKVPNPVWWGLGILTVGGIIYFKGRADGNKCSLLDRITGGCDSDKDPAKVYVGGGDTSGNWKPNSITNALHSAFENLRWWDTFNWFDGSEQEFNAAFTSFNNLDRSQKIAVVNDWEVRIKGTDRPGWGTGDYGSLTKEISQYSDNLLPAVAIAYQWLNDNGIV